MGYSEEHSRPAGILVAEDDEAISMFIEAVLAGAGYRVIKAADGEEAVRHYREQGPFDLAVLDIHMPRLNGPGALEQIRALNPALRALVLSGTPDEAARPVPEWGQGFDGFLCKPFDALELVEAVRRLLDRPRGS